MLIEVKGKMKLTKLRQKMQDEAIDGLLVTNPINRMYITGFTGTAGVALITKDAAVFITDFRYTEQAKEEAQQFTIIQHQKSLIEEIAKQIKQLHIEKLGFEQDDVNFATYKKYEEHFFTQLVPVSNIIESLRLIKTEDELQILREAAQIADKAFEHILTFIKPGIKEVDVATELEFFMRKEGATSSSFDIIVASGYRSALPHGVASEKEIASGELVTMDFGALYKGYCSDITRTVAVGDISEELNKIYHIVLEAEKLGVKNIKAGMTGKEADQFTRDYITEQGYGEYFGHSTGHGIGLEVHENPRLASTSDDILKENMVVTVEPGIYVPNVGGCRIEDDIILTETGNEVITHSPKELITL